MREYTYKVWDKKTPFLNKSAEQWLIDFPHLRNGDSVLILIDGNIEQIYNLNLIRIDLDLRPDVPLDEVMHQFIDNLVNEREQEPVYVHKNTELKKELYQAKLTMMKEGLI